MRAKGNQIEHLKPPYLVYKVLAMAVSVVPSMMARPSGNRVISFETTRKAKVPW